MYQYLSLLVELLRAVALFARLVTVCCVPPLLEDVLIYQVVVSANVTLVKLLQYKKAFLPIFVTLAGMIIDSKSQLSKAESPILVDVSGSVIDVNEV